VTGVGRLILQTRGCIFGLFQGVFLRFARLNQGKEMLEQIQELYLDAGFTAHPILLISLLLFVAGAWILLTIKGLRLLPISRRSCPTRNRPYRIL
jgi:hypothetical protein